MLANMVIVNTTTHIVNEKYLLYRLTYRTTGIYENKKSGTLSKMRWIPLWWTLASLFRTFLFSFYKIND